jgi:hypothetical protein
VEQDVQEGVGEGGGEVNDIKVRNEAETSGTDAARGGKRSRRASESARLRGWRVGWRMVGTLGSGKICETRGMRTKSIKTQIK